MKYVRYTQYVPQNKTPSININKNRKETKNHPSTADSTYEQTSSVCIRDPSTKTRDEYNCTNPVRMLSKNKAIITSPVHVAKEPDHRKRKLDNLHVPK